MIVPKTVFLHHEIRFEQTVTLFHKSIARSEVHISTKHNRENFRRIRPSNPIPARGRH